MKHFYVECFNKFLVAAMLLIISVPAHAEKFTTADFLTWKRESQDFYIDANVGMASLVTGQVNKRQGKCIDDWFYSDVPKATKEIISVMKQFQGYHPRGVILAVIEQNCGKIVSE